MPAVRTSVVAAARLAILGSTARLSPAQTAPVDAAVSVSDARHRLTLATDPVA
jgi:hypothetical protein